MPRATSASKKSRALRGWSSRRLVRVSASRGPLANSVKSPSSTALSKVLDPQNQAGGSDLESLSVQPLRSAFALLLFPEGQLAVCQQAGQQRTELHGQDKLGGRACPHYF